MKSIKGLLTIMALFIICSAARLGGGEGKGSVYAFGVSTSFTDTIVYYTEIQLLDSVKLEKGFLPKRESYSYQMKNYLEYQRGLKNRTCMIYFSGSRKKIESEMGRVMSKYQKNKVTIEQIDKADFVFKKPE